MKDLQRLAELDVIGYAESLTPESWPAIVPPVFRLRGCPDRVFVPPYALKAGYLISATEINGAEARVLEAREEITSLAPPIPAQDEYVLWIDGQGQTRYEPAGVAHAALRQIARVAETAAEEALRRGEWQTAESQASLALRADDRRLQPLVILGAIREKQNRLAALRLMAKMAEPWVSEERFLALVRECQPAVPTRKPSATCAPMQGMAAVR